MVEHLRVFHHVGFFVDATNQRLRKDKLMSHSKGTHTFATQKTVNAPHTVLAVASMPTHDDIAKRAYDIYIRTGSRQGQCKQNWQQAEQDLRNEGTKACH